MATNDASRACVRLHIAPIHAFTMLTLRTCFHHVPSSPSCVNTECVDVEISMTRKIVQVTVPFSDSTSVERAKVLFMHVFLSCQGGLHFARQSFAGFSQSNCWLWFLMCFASPALPAVTQQPLAALACKRYRILLVGKVYKVCSNPAAVGGSSCKSFRV